MFTKGFGEIIVDALTVNPALKELPSVSAILDTSNYTFNAITYGKDAEGFNFHGHTVNSIQYVNGDSDSGVSGYNNGDILTVNYLNTAPFVSSYELSGTQLQFSSTYNSVPAYPSVAHTRLESESTKSMTASSFSLVPFAAVTDGSNDEIFTYTSDTTAPTQTGYRVDDLVTFATCAVAVPLGLTPGTQYWVVGVDTTLPYAIRVSDTKGGTPITPTEAVFFLVRRIPGGMPDLGHYVNSWVDSEFSSIWNILGGFAPPSSVGAIYQLLDSNGNQITSGVLSGIYNQNGVIDREGYIKISQVSGLGTSLLAELSGGPVVFSAAGLSPGQGVTNIAVVPQYSDSVTLALFGGVNHIGVYCLDLRSMLALGITPPFSWDALNNNRKYKMVAKVTMLDNLMKHYDFERAAGFGVLAGLSYLNTGWFEFYTNKGPTFILKFNFL